MNDAVQTMTLSPKAITADTLDSSHIDALKMEAIQHGDAKMAAICGAAKGGNRPARAVVAEVVRGTHLNIADDYREKLTGDLTPEDREFYIGQIRTHEEKGGRIFVIR